MSETRERHTLKDLSIRELLMCQVSLLHEIRNLIETTVTAANEEDDEEPGICTHPLELRRDVSGMGDPDHWICAVCKFDNKQHRMN